MRKEKILEILENAKDERGAVPMRLVRQAFDKLPTAQPEERTESHARDLISRQAVIDEVKDWIKSKEFRRSNATYYIKKRINALPSIQPAQLEAIPVSWIEGQIAELKSTGKTTSYILGELISAMVRKWKEDGDAE